MQVAEGYWGRWHLGGMAVASMALFAPATAFAQGVTADQIKVIESEIHGLQGQVEQLKVELRETKGQLRQSQREAAQAKAIAHAAAVRGGGMGPGAPGPVAAGYPVAAAGYPVTQAPPPAPILAPVASAPVPPKPGPHVVQTPSNRFGLESGDKQNSIYLTGRLHFDTGDYLNYHAQSPFASTQDLNSGVNARRARLGVTGKFAGDWNYTFIYDFGGSSDGLPPTSGAPSTGIQTADITYNGFNKGPLPLAFDAGYMTVPFTLEQSTSSNDMPFVERPSPQAIAANIMAGSYRSALGVRSNNSRYWAGVYLTGPTSGAAHNTGEQYGAVGRVAYQVVQGPDYTVHLGGDLGGLLKPPTVAGVQTVTLSDRPELRVDPTAILTTGSLGTPENPVKGAWVSGIEAAAGWRNFFLQGEYYHIAVDYSGTGMPSNGFNGGYVEGSWTLTGEARRYNAANGSYFGIVPARPFRPWAPDGGWGAFEVAARYSMINLNDAYFSGAADEPANATEGGRQTVYAAALNWYPNTNMRFMFDYLHGSIARNFSDAGGGIAGTPDGTPVGGKFDAVVLRSQFAF